MALTPKRAAMGAVALCGLIAVAYLPPSPEPGGPRFIDRRPRTVERRAANRARTRVEQAVRQLLQSRRRDSLLAQLREQSLETPFLHFSPDVSQPSREWFRREVSQRWSILGQTGGYPVGVLVVMDTSAELGRLRERWWRRASLNYYMPASLDGHACVTVVRLRESHASEENGEFQWHLRDGQRPALFGPCAFYAIFGEAGRTLSQWLDSPSGFYGSSFETTVRSVPVREGRDRTFELPGWSPGSGPQHRAGYLDVPACLVGRTDRCSHLVSDPTGPIGSIPSSDVPVLEGVRTYRFGAGSDNSYPLSDLLAEKGREAFAVFWRSNEPLEQAFETAFGEPLGEFVHRWIKSRAPAPPRGWRIPASSVFVSVVLLVGLVVASAAHATTRHVEGS